jgi:hypothetical protein
MAIVMVMSEAEWVAAGRPMANEAVDYRDVWAVAPDAVGWPADDVRAIEEGWSDADLGKGEA